MNTIYISHVSQDDLTAERLCQSLERAGFHTWIDHRDIAAGENWVQAIQKASVLANGVLVIGSKAALKSAYIQRECASFLEMRKPIFLVKIESVKVNPRIAWQESAHVVDLTKDFDHGVEKLLPALHNTFQNQAGIAQSVQAVISPITLTIQIAGDNDELKDWLQRFLTKLPDLTTEKVNVLSHDLR